MGLRTYDYIVTLKSNTSNHRAFNLISLLLVIIAITGTVYAALTSTYQKEKISAIAIAVILTLSALYAFFASGSYRISLFISVMSLIIFFKAYLIAGLYAVSAILERQVKFKQEIGFDEEGVTLNSFPKKRYKWHEVNNVVLKDGIITIDLYNNKIIQKELEDESDDLEVEFNEFCRSHLLSV